MIRKRKNKRANGKTTTFYQAVVYFKGEVVSRKSFDTKVQAAIYEQEVLKKCKLGKQGLNDGYTFGMCIEDYLKSDFKQLDKTTQYCRNSTIRYLSTSPIASCPMDEFSDLTLDNWIDWLLNHKTALNPRRKSFSQELSMLTIILNWYRESRDSTFIQPILKRHRKRCAYKEIQERVPDYYINPKDVVPWLNFLRERVADIVYYRLALFMILTGCRVGEAAGLCWDAVQLSCEKPFVKIMRTRNWFSNSGQEKIKSRVKTKNARRTINLPPILVDELKKIKIMEIEGEKPVFYKNGGTLFTIRTIHNHFNKAFRYLNLPWKGTHIARHTSGTLALIASKDLAVVQAMLGHSNVTQTQEYAKIIALQDNFTPHKTAELLGL